MLVVKTTLLLLACLASVHGLPTIVWDENRGVACDFPGDDMKILRIPGEECEPLCEKTLDCSHYVWSTEKGGTCKLKTGSVTQSDAVYTGKNSMICGILKVDTAWDAVKRAIRTTYDSETEIGACELPTAEYTTPYSIALGDLHELGDLKFKPELCGHVITLDCGLGSLEVIVSNSVVNGGNALYASTWERATGNTKSGVTRCSIALSSSTAMMDDEPLCYHANTQDSNEYWRKVGLFNTKEQLVVGATLNRIAGVRSGPYFQISGKAAPSDFVVFRFKHGGEYSVPLSACLNGTEKEIWS